MFSIHCLSLFPQEIEAFFLKGILKRAHDQGLFNFKVVDLRNFGAGKHNKVDDYPFSEKKGMLLRADVIFNAVTSIEDYQNMRIIYTCPKGPLFNQVQAKGFYETKQSLIIIPGYYEGIDERIFDVLPIERVSIGNYILNSGELAALVVAESVLRYLPGVLGNEACIEDDSICANQLEAGQYTQPLSFQGHAVPDVLRSGHHAKVAEWKLKESLKTTLFKRPDLLKDKDFNKQDRSIMTDILNEMVVKNNDK